MRRLFKDISTVFFMLVFKIKINAAAEIKQNILEFIKTINHRFVVSKIVFFNRSASLFFVICSYWLAIVQDLSNQHFNFSDSSASWLEGII